MTGRSGRDGLPLVLLALLIVVRVPSLVQPLGPDQSLYAYVAQEIGRGGWPYLDAWDQKPPGIHLIYAGLFALWPDDSVIALADLVASGAVALLLASLAAWWSGSRAAGWTSAALFLALGDPAWQRLGGLRVRSQSEVFIALAVTLAVWLAVKARHSRSWSVALAAASGALVGCATILKYPAALYGAIPLAVLLWPVPGGGAIRLPRRVVALVAGAAFPLAVMIAAYWSAGGLADLVDATVFYNLRYSGDTYGGPGHFVAYLATFPVQHARVDGLWLVGGAGALVLLACVRREPRLAVIFGWLACAMAAIAINGSRGLPQYFVQAAPAWALAAGLGAERAWTRLGLIGRVAMIVVASFGVWRVVEADNYARAFTRDVAMMRGATSRGAYIESFGERRGDKFRLASTLALADELRRRSSPDQRVLVYGFAPAAYVYAPRRSASRFFWSAPVADGFNAGKRGYGPQGLLDDLTRHPPAVVAIQTDPDSIARSFWREPILVDWLRGHYVRAPTVGVFDVWIPKP